MTCHTLIKSPAPPAGDCAGVFLSSRTTVLPAVEHCSGGEDSFSLIHDARKHVCKCGVGYVNKPFDCHSCGAEMRTWNWMNRRAAAKAIIQEAHNG